MDFVNRRPGLTALIAFIAGLVIGLVVLGWWLFPVQYEGADPSGLFPEYQGVFVRNAAELYAFDNNQEKLRNALGGWGGDVVACSLAADSLDPADQQRLIAAATLVNGQGCTGALQTEAVSSATGEDQGTPSWLPLFLLGLLLLLLLVAILYVYNRRRSLLSDTTEDAQGYPVAAPAKAAPRQSAPTAARPDVSPAAVPVAEPVTVPIARFRTNYTRGHDTYDDSFSIENAAGDFLGECGVGISETLGSGTPRNVTAFEVWLFDKNDIRTITKVIMSDHAYFDEAIKAKLAPKGEPVLARENETIVLETASLIINAEITEMAYGQGSEMPDSSYFDRFTIELSAWAKEGDYVAQAGDSADLLNY